MLFINFYIIYIIAKICLSQFQNICTLEQLKAKFCVSKWKQCGSTEDYCNSQAIWTYSCNQAAAMASSNGNYYVNPAANAATLPCNEDKDCGSLYTCLYGYCQGVRSNAPATTTAPIAVESRTGSAATTSTAGTIGGIVGVSIVLTLIVALVIYSKIRPDWTTTVKDSRTASSDKKLEKPLVGKHGTSPRLEKMEDGRKSGDVTPRKRLTNQH